MNYRRVPTTDLVVSEIGLGSFLTYGRSVDLARSKSCIAAAMDGGVNFFDTANTYGDGRSEEILGRLLRDYRRSDFVIATKCYFPHSGDPQSGGLSRPKVQAAVEKSMARLGVEHIDLLQCHRFDEKTPVEETVEAMSDLVRRGVIRYWGVSRWTATQVGEAHRAADKAGRERGVTNQIAYSLLHRGEEHGYLPVAREQKTGVIVYGALAQGVLSGKYSEAVPVGSRAGEPVGASFMYHRDEASLAKANSFASFARDRGFSPTALALAWCLRKPEVSCVLMGASSAEQVRENVAASELPREASLWNEIERKLGERT